MGIPFSYVLWFSGFIFKELCHHLKLGGSGLWPSERETKTSPYGVKSWGEFCIWIVSKEHDWAWIYNANSDSEKATWRCKVAYLDW